MIKLLKSNKGASSVLVILLLVVLVVFGVAALTTALSNVRLGQKVVGWDDKYYAAEAQANEMYAQIDTAVQFPPFSLTSSDPYFSMQYTVEQLDLGIESNLENEHIDFMYEAWQDDVGIAVVLRLSKATDELTIIQWRVVQQ